MHDSLKACPVSGEIMAGTATTTARRHGLARDGRRDVVEAEFETVRPDAPLQGFRDPRAKAPEGIEFLQKRSKWHGTGKMEYIRKAEKSGKAPGTRWAGFVFWMAGAALVTLAFLISGGSVLVGGTRLGLPSGAGLNDNFHTAGIPVQAADSKAHGGSPGDHFLGTSADRTQAGGSFVFSDQLETPKDRGKSTSISFSKED